MNMISIKILKHTRILFLTFSILFVSCKTETKTTTSTGDLTSKMTKPDKKKYYNSSNTAVYEVKYKDDGFKLRTASSDLLWKVKLYENKVKISDNEENLDPYEIKKLNNGEAKLEKNDTTIERGTADNARNLVNSIDGMPQDQKDILVAELKEKGF